MRYQSFNLRLPGATKGRILAAAAMAGLKPSDFCRRALDREAERVLAAGIERAAPRTSDAANGHG